MQGLKKPRFNLALFVHRRISNVSLCGFKQNLVTAKEDGNLLLLMVLL